MHVWINRVLVAGWLTFADSSTSYVLSQYHVRTSGNRYWCNKGQNESCSFPLWLGHCCLCVWTMRPVPLPKQLVCARLLATLDWVLEQQAWRKSDFILRSYVKSYSTTTDPLCHCRLDAHQWYPVDMFQHSRVCLCWQRTFTARKQCLKLCFLK